MKILGLDLSLTATGIVTLNDGVIEYEDCIQSKYKGAKRVDDILFNIKSRISENKFDIICIEGYAYAIQNGRMFDLAELAGVVKNYIYNRCEITKEKIIIIPPTTLKKFVTGSGNSKKELMLLKAYKKYNIEFDNDNICDAFCLAKFGEEYLKSKDKKEDCFKKIIEVI